MALEQPAADEVIDQRFEQQLSDTTNRLIELCAKGNLDKKGCSLNQKLITHVLKLSSASPLQICFLRAGWTTVGNISSQVTNDADCSMNWQTYTASY